MKVSVSLDFNTVEEAIKFLGDKVMGPAPHGKLEAAPKPAPTGFVRAKIRAGRGPGRPKKIVAPDASLPSAAPTPAPAAPAATPEPASPVKNPPIETVQATSTPEAASPVPSEDEVRAALQAVLDSVGMNKVTATLARFGVKRGREITPEQRTEFIAYCDQVARKEVDPEQAK